MEDIGQEDCIAHTVARNGVGHVAACRHCGSVYLTLDHLTLRLQFEDACCVACHVQEISTARERLAA